MGNSNSGRLRLALVILVLVLFVIAVFGQSGQRVSGHVPGRFVRSGGKITGIVQDSVSGKRIEYANVMLFRLPDSTMVTGNITDESGKFVIDGVKPGRYFVKVDFIGFKMKSVNNIEIKPGKTEVDLGVIYLAPGAIQMKEVEVIGEKPLVSYSIDRKVINVDRHITASAGTAVEILERVPSVNVDIEGNVTLRGSGNFTVLIDNRPTILDGSEALQQIPAAAIERIEIITNPSAKYDPDGVAGIINVILKKDVKSTLGGMVNSSVSSTGGYGTNMTFSLGNKKIRYSLGVDYNKRIFPGSRELINEAYHDGAVTVVQTSGNSEMKWNPYGLRGEILFNLSRKTTISLGGRYGIRSMERLSNSTVTELNGCIITRNSNEEIWKRSGDFNSLYLDFTHNFSSRRHYFKAQVDYGSMGSDEESRTEMRNDLGEIIYAQKNVEKGPKERIRYRLEYVLPLDSTKKFEVGVSARIGKFENSSKYYEYDITKSTYIFNSLYSHTITTSRNIQSVYALFSDKIGKFGYQLGLRGEYTYRYITYVDSNYSFKIDRWDFFPTFHFSYQINNLQQLMLSYSKRIHRPRGWELGPFLTWMDAYNVRCGNPQLKPEYTDSYEAGVQTFWGKNLISIEGFYRKTYNKIERVQSVYSENVILHTVDNVGKDYSMGLEFMVNFNPFRWWNFDLMVNTYNYKIEGQLNGENFSRKSFNWNSRFINEFKISQKLQAQLMIMYNSKSVSAQGERNGFFVTDLGIRYSVIPGKLFAIFQVRDLFGTGEFKYKSCGSGFRTYGHFSRKAPMLNLTLRYNFNNYRENKSRKMNEIESEDFEEPMIY